MLDLPKTLIISLAFSSQCSTYNPYALCSKVVNSANPARTHPKDTAMDMKTSPISLLKDPSLLKTDALINGQWIAGSARFDVHDPSNGMKLADVADLGPQDAEAAIAAANAAWPAWRKKTGKERHAILMKWFQLLIANADDLGRILTAEQGKPFAEAKGEVVYGASFVEWFAEEAKRVNGETLPQFDNNRRLMVIKEPIGVCAAITPWNFPLAMITRKVAPALAAGCPVVIKPAELTPLTALAAAELAMRAGIPAGVLNVVTSTHSSDIGKVLCASPVVRHLSFTGSTQVGRILMAQCAPTVKKLALELGGNAPFIVFDDADVDSAVEGAMASKYRNAGQTCVCANRIYVQDGVYEQFVERFAARFKAEQEAIDAANNTEFGLASYFYSRDVGRIFRVAEALEYGMVGINVGVIATEHVPFGGVKQSGLGREGSSHGMEEYVEMKYLCLGDIQK